ncbi:MAG: hypothetical protein LBE89_03035 [Helicobacteraceae bacterium]|nr:hypothetical protein [Helicobacteraceae bacterium]
MVKRLAFLLALFFAGCASEGVNREIGSIPSIAPEWITHRSSPFEAVAGAAPSVGGMKFQQIEVDAAAKRVVRNALEQTVRTMKDDLAGVFPEIDADRIAAHIENAARFVATKSNNDIKRIDNWWSPSLEYYALYTIDRERVEANVMESISLIISTDREMAGLLSDPKRIEAIRTAAQKAIADQSKSSR